MRVIKFSILILLFILIMGVSFIFNQQEVVIRIQKGMPAIPVALPKFIIKTDNPEIMESAKTIYQVLRDDLIFSRVFQLTPKEFYSYIRPLDPKNIFFKDWESIQTNILIVGEVTESEGNKLIFNANVYDVQSARFIFGRRYRGEAKLARLIAHKMADEMMRTFGEKPIFTSKIVFVSDRDGNQEIYMMDYDGHNQIRLTFNKDVDMLPSLSPDRIKVAYTSYRRGNPDLFVFSIYEGKTIPLSTKGINYAPSWSPDGKKIVFCTSRSGNTEIYVANRDGTNLHRLTFNKAIDTSPAWSPTGREIAFTSDRGGTPQIYIMDAEGSNVRKVSYGGTYHDSPSWSPDGDKIAYVSRVENRFDIYVLDLRTNQIIKITENNARNENPSWSPDGRHLVYSSNLSGTTQLYITDYDGLNTRVLTSKGNNKMPDWSR
ncbi:MAG: Tol-Pal system beta propeller repeat protein TolB [Candidatus Aminicenantia bacterium]